MVLVRSSNTYFPRARDGIVPFAGTRDPCSALLDTAAHLHDARFRAKNNHATSPSGQATGPRRKPHDREDVTAYGAPSCCWTGGHPLWVCTHRRNPRYSMTRIRDKLIWEECAPSHVDDQLSALRAAIARGTCLARVYTLSPSCKPTWRADRVSSDLPCRVRPYLAHTSCYTLHTHNKLSETFFCETR